MPISLKTFADLVPFSFAVISRVLELSNVHIPQLPERADGDASHAAADRASAAAPHQDDRHAVRLCTTASLPRLHYPTASLPHPLGDSMSLVRIVCVHIGHAYLCPCVLLQPPADQVHRGRTAHHQASLPTNQQIRHHNQGRCSLGGASAMRIHT